MNAIDSIHFYNQITKLFGKKASMTSTNLLDDTAIATVTDKDGREWEIKMLVKE